MRALIPAAKATAPLSVAVLLVIGCSLNVGAVGHVPAVPVVTLRATAAPGVVHHHHHHVVVLQGGAHHDAPPSKATMAALLQLPRQLVSQQMPATTALHPMVPPRAVYQSVSTVGSGVTHQYHFHRAHDLHAPARLHLPAQDPDSEWYAKQQSARVVALVNKLRDLGVHVDEVHAEYAEPPINKQEEKVKSSSKDEHKESSPSPNVEVEDSAKPVTLGEESDGTTEEQVQKELLKFIAKLSKKQKELHFQQNGWHSRQDVAGDFLAGGDLDVNVDAPQTVFDELIQLGADMGERVGLPT